MTSWHEWKEPIYAAAGALGFAPRETEFVEVSADALYQAAAYGLPGMYPHWSRGRDYWIMKSQFEHGLNRIYEMVTNTEPALAYLLADNTLSDNLFVIAHVAGHADFFDRNVLMKQARRDMIPYLHAASERFRAYEFEYGVQALETLLDLGHALSDHVDEAAAPPRIEKAPHASAPSEFTDLLGDADVRSHEERAAEFSQRREQARAGLPCSDLLYYLVWKAPLEPWQRDVLTVVREVAIHQRPQRLTKVVDEGWACYVGLKTLRSMDLPPEVHWSQAELHSAIAHGNSLSLNPYWLGWRLWEHLEEIGADVHALCSAESDTSFLRNWIDEAFVRDQRLYTWAVANSANSDGSRDVRIVTRDWQAVREKIVAAHTPQIPHINVVRKESDGCLVLGADGALEKDDALKIMAAIARLWKGKVALEWRTEETTDRWEATGGVNHG